MSYFSKFVVSFALILFFSVSLPVWAQESKTYQGGVSIQSGFLSNGDEFAVDVVVLDSALGFETGVFKRQSFTYDDTLASYNYSINLTSSEYFDDTMFFGGKIVIRFRCISCSAPLVDSYYNSMGAMAFRGFAEGVENFNENPNSNTLTGLNFQALVGDTLSVDVQLPTALVNPTGQVRIQARVIDQNTGSEPGSMSFGQAIISDSLAISGAVNDTLSFSVTVPPLPVDAYYQVSYVCFQMEGCTSEIFEQGYLNTTLGTQARSSESEQLTDISSTINLPVLEANIVSGVLERGAGIDTSVAFGTDVCIDGSAISSSCQYLEFAVGEISKAFSFTVPELASNPNFYLYYDCSFSFNGCPNGAVQRAYYNGNGNESVATQSSVTQPIGGLGATGVQFPMLVAQQLSLTLNRPLGAPTSDAISVNFSIEDQNSFDNNVFETFDFGIGVSQATKTISVPSLSGSNYRVTYSCSGCAANGVFESGTYDGSGFIAGNRYSTTVSDLSFLDAASLDLLPGSLVSASVLLPNSEVAASQIELNFSLSDYSDMNDSFYLSGSTVIIDAGQNSGQLDLAVPTSLSSIALDYSCSFECDGIVANGYYDGSGLVSGFTTISDLSNLSGAQLVLPTAQMIQGTIQLPPGQQATMPIQLSVYVNDDSAGNFVDSADVTIDVNQSSTSFSIEAASLTGSFSVQVQCISGCNGILESTYFNGTDLQPEYVTVSDLSVLTTQSLELLEAIQIVGTIQFPQSLSIQEGVSIALSSDSGGLSFSAFVDVPAGSQSQQYSISVPATVVANDFRLNFFCFGCSSNGVFYEQGYYSTSGTVFSFSNAFVGSLDSFDGVTLDVALSQVVTFTLNTPSSSPLSEQASGSVEFVSNGTFLTVGSYSFDVGTDTSQLISVNLPDSISEVEIQASCFGCTEIAEYTYFDGTQFSYDFNDRQAVSIAQLSGGIFELLPPFTFSGLLSVPPEVVREGDLQITLTLRDLDPEFGQVYSTQLTLPELENSIAFSFPDAPRFRQYELTYSCDACPGIIQSGAYDGQGFNADISSAAQVFDLTQLNADNLELIPARIVQGSIAVPTGVVSHPEYGVSLFFTDSNFQTYFTSATIPQDGVSAAFSVELPQSAESYVIEYSCDNCPGVLNRGYFSSAGTVISRDDAESVSDLENALQADFFMLEVETVSGNVARPVNTDSQEPLEITVDITAFDEDGNFVSFVGSETLNFNPGDASAALDLNLPTEEGLVFQISYYCLTCPEDVFSNGFFTTDGTTPAYSEPSVSLADFQQPFTFVLLQAESISGELILPPALSIVGDTTVFVYANVRDGDELISVASDFVSISDDPNEQGRAEFQLNVPVVSGATITLEYSCFSCDDFISPIAFYSDLGSTEDETQAQVYDFDQLPSNSLEFTMLESAIISGTVRRPSGSSTDEDLFIQLAARENRDNSGFNRSIYVFLASGESEVSYTMPVPRNSDLFVNYFCFGCTDIWRVGYYSAAGTQPVYGKAEFVNSGLNGLVDIDLDLVEAVLLSGSLSRHSTDSNTAEVLPVVIANVVDQNSELDADFIATGYGQQLFIPQGQQDTLFSIEVPALTQGGYLLRYECSAGCGEDTFNKGYFAGVSSEAEFDVADAVIVTQADNLQNLSFAMLPGRTIAGELVRPTGAANDDEIAASVHANSSDDSVGSQLQFASFAPTVLPELVNSVAYSITVPALSENDYLVRYDCVACDGVFPFGYFSEEGTKFSADEADEIADTGGLLEQVDLQLSASQVVGGNLSRSLEDTSQPSLSVGLSLTAVDDSGQPVGPVFAIDPFDSDSVDAQRLDVEIPEMVSTVPYSTTVPAEVAASGFVLDYLCDECEATVDLGFYSAQAAVAEVENAEVVTIGSGDLGSLSFALLSDVDDDEIASGQDNCPMIANASQDNFDTDAFGDVCDPDIDNDGSLNDLDSDDMNASICSDQDLDMCDDCSSGSFDVLNDGLDTDIDGLCDIGDLDDDGDLVSDIEDCAPLLSDRYQFLSGFLDVDQDDFGVGQSIQVCSGVSLPAGYTSSQAVDNCPDIANPNQENFDGDEFGDVCDADADNDNVNDAQDGDPFNARACSDLDLDMCDDCSSGQFNLAQDGRDTDQDGMCNVGDLDDDNDTIEDALDNCPVNANPDQLDTDDNGIGNVCDGDLCIPIKTPSDKIALICL